MQVSHSSAPVNYSSAYCSSSLPLRQMPPWPGRHKTLGPMTGQSVTGIQLIKGKTPGGPLALKIYIWFLNNGLRS